MCGICGFIDKKNTLSETTLFKMNDILAHRGPDNGAIWYEDNVGLGHRRLSIIDLSESGNQPMYSFDNRYVIVFNGEIYNYKELKNELILRGYTFRGKSDTEVILNGFHAWGVNIFNKLNGIFGIAIWDKINRELFLVRDRMGVKPLYYCSENQIFSFASEIKSLLVLRKQDSFINYSALSQWAYFGNPTGEQTLYSSIIKLPPASFLKYKDGLVEVNRYWHIESIAENTSISELQAIELLREYIEKAINRQLVSDVPVGIFLSGGVDSGAITAFASKYYQDKLSTFTAEFDFAVAESEKTRAERIATKFKTQHSLIPISGKNIESITERLIWHHDEPFADAANIPLYLLSQQLKGTIKVILQGDGGDELFGGYLRYKTLSCLEKKPYIQYLAELSNVVLKQIPKNIKFNRINRYVNALSKHSDALKMALLLTVDTDYNSPYNIFIKDIQEKLREENPFFDYIKWEKKFSNKNLVQRMLFVDSQIILPNTFNEKVDKSTMANGIEVRVPFLDNELVNFALSIPSQLKVKKGTQKYLLKKSLEGILPDEILYGKKLGFAVPYQNWIKTTLKEHFLDLLNNQKNIVIDKKNVEKMFNRYIDNKEDNAFLLWKTYNILIWNQIYAVKY